VRMWRTASGHPESYCNTRPLCRSIYAANVAKYDAFNAEGGHTYTLGANAFTDLLPTEFQSRFMTAKPPPSWPRAISHQSVDALG
jgi:hypothetical protein